MKILNLTALILILSSAAIKAQIIKSKLDIVGGLSAREYLHLGLRYQYTDITQLGVYVGSDLELRGDEKINTYCVDNQVHFGKLSFHNNRPVWYARQGFTYSINNLGDQETRKYSYIDLSLGREFALSNRLGVNIDLGMVIQFREYRDVKPPKGPLETPLRTDKFIYPLARIQLYYSF